MDAGPQGQGGVGVPEVVQADLGQLGLSSPTRTNQRLTELGGSARPSLRVKTSPLSVQSLGSLALDELTGGVRPKHRHRPLVEGDRAPAVGRLGL